MEKVRNYQISSGEGPAECELAVAKLLEWLKKRYSIAVLQAFAGQKTGTYRSVLFACGEDLSEFEGSIVWICRSPYRPEHKRKNWYLNFSCCDRADFLDFDQTQVLFQTFRSGGKGGQHVNKVETGVRAIYLPTGESVECTEERSQFANKQKAIARLKEHMIRANAKRRAAEKNDNWRCHTQIERGNAGAKFSGINFQKV